MSADKRDDESLPKRTVTGPLPWSRRPLRGFMWWPTNLFRLNQNIKPTLTAKQ
jgi:hypothetical protein